MKNLKNYFTRETLAWGVNKISGISKDSVKKAVSAYQFLKGKLGYGRSYSGVKTALLAGAGVAVLAGSAFLYNKYGDGKFDLSQFKL